MSEIVQLYTDDNVKAYPKTLASEVYLDDGSTKIMDKFDKVNSQLDTIKTYITPEMFNGSNDYEKLQNAINYAIANKKLLTCKGEKTYNIDNTLLINGVLNADFNGVTIKATTNNTVIEINHKGINSYNGKIENLTIDCNNISDIGIKLTFSQRREFKSIKVININNVGIQCDAGNVNKFNYIWLQALNTKINTVGFKNNVYDNVVSHMDIINCYTSVEHNNGNCFYHEVHGLITNPKVMYKGSIFFKMNSYHHVILDKCYPDTQQIYYYLGNKGKLSITNNYGFNNYEILNDTHFADGTKGYIFYCKDNNASYLDRVSMNGSMMNGFIDSRSNFKYEITNISNGNTMLKINTTNHFYNFPKIQSCSNNALISVTTSIPVTQNIIKLAQETFSLQVEFNYNPSVHGVFSSTVGRYIGLLPNSYMYNKDIDYSFPVEYGVMVGGHYVTIGFIKGMIKSSEQKIYVMATKDMYDSRTILCSPTNNTDYILKINITCPMYQY